MLRRLDFNEKVEAMKILYKDAKSTHAGDSVSHNVLVTTPHDKESVSFSAIWFFAGHLAFVGILLTCTCQFKLQTCSNLWPTVEVIEEWKKKGYV